MPTINLNDIDSINVRTITVFEGMLDDFNNKIEIEEKKYPLTDREKIFVDIIKDLLTKLDKAYKR